MSQAAQNTIDKVVLGPATNALTTSRSASFDFLGADYATIRVIQSQTGTAAGTNGGLATVSLLHADSDPTQATQFATFVADVTAQVTTSHEMLYHVDLGTKKRYGKIILTPHTSSNDGVVTCVLLTTGRLGASPSNTTTMVSTTNDVVRIVA
jgi:hypothetical protein